MKNFIHEIKQAAKGFYKGITQDPYHEGYLWFSLTLISFVVIILLCVTIGAVVG